MKSTFSVLTLSFEIVQETISVLFLSAYITGSANHGAVTAYMIIFFRHWYSSFLRSNQLHWLSENWCSIEQYRSRKTFGFWTSVFYKQVVLKVIKSKTNRDDSMGYSHKKFTFLGVFKKWLLYYNFGGKGSAMSVYMNMSVEPIWALLKIKAQVNMPEIKTGRIF